jgi:hypothetical protein
VERANPEAVPRQEQLLTALIPQRQGKLATQALKHPFAKILPQMREHFGIAVGPEAMAPSFQLSAQLRIVEELPIVNDGHAALFIADRLPAIRQSDDTEPPRRQAQPWSFQIALLIGTTVDQGVSHGGQDAGG